MGNEKLDELEMKIRCPFTNKDVNAIGANKLYNYEVVICDKKQIVKICKECIHKYENKIEPHIGLSLMLNGKWPKNQLIKTNGCDQYDFGNEIDLDSFLNSLSYPKTASQKLEFLFKHLYNMQTEDGQTNIFDFNKEYIWRSLYFKSEKECLFYYKTIASLGYAEINNTAYQILFKGLSYYQELEKNGNTSNKCFIAMAFDDTLKTSRSAIKKALKATSYHETIIDEEHLKSDQTIPDGIFAGIRESHFCIADFSLHKKGVYFEAGYALGLGKPVIYVCSEKQFKKAHFDIKQLQHIIYKDEKDLEKKLIEKIKAWIK